MLARIGAAAVVAMPVCLEDLMKHRGASGRFALTDNVRLLVDGHTPDDLLPALTAALKARFDGIQPEQLTRDLLDPVKKGVGNAYKWGNHSDPALKIHVEVAATRRGVLVTITDEGAGFDVERVLAAYRNHEHYFTHGGSGIAHFDRARSSISYGDEGRTVLICFACGEGSAQDLGRDQPRGGGFDANTFKQLVVERLPLAGAADQPVESCHVYLTDEWPEPGSEARCALVRPGDGSAADRRMVVTARLLNEAQAARDFATAQALFEGPFRGAMGIRIPQPLMVLDPLPVVLYEFEPSHDFREHLKTLNTTAVLTATMRDVADALRTLHGSGIPAVEERLDEAIPRGLTGHPQAMATLRAFSPELAERARRSFDRLMQRAATIRLVDPVPIHGAFETSAIVHEAGRLFLYRFESCRRSHPGFDVGTFVTELLRFYQRKKSERTNYRIARDEFLNRYFDGASSTWRSDVPFFTAYALHQRLHTLLRRPRDKWEPKVEALLEQCDEALSEGAWV
jgi:hypothetical protein